MLDESRSYDHVRIAGVSLWGAMPPGPIKDLELLSGSWASPADSAGTVHSRPRQKGVEGGVEGSSVEGRPQLCRGKTIAVWRGDHSCVEGRP